MVEKADKLGFGEKLVGVTEVADATGLPVSWIYSQAAAGRIPHLKIGKYLKFRPSEIEDWLESRRRGESPRSTGGELG